MLQIEQVEADPERAAALQINTGEPVIHLERLRYWDEEPVAVVNNWLPIHVASLSKKDLETWGLYELLNRRGVNIRLANQAIGARIATPRDARLLGISKGAALVTVKRTAYDDAGRPIEFGSHVYRADRYSFETTLVQR